MQVPRKSLFLLDTQNLMNSSPALNTGLTCNLYTNTRALTLRATITLFLPLSSVQQSVALAGHTNTVSGFFLPLNSQHNLSEMLANLIAVRCGSAKLRFKAQFCRNVNVDMH